MSSDEYEAWKEEREKERVLNFISLKGTLDATQVSDILGKSLKETESILSKLEEEKFIENVHGNFFHLTYEGKKRVRECARAEKR